MREFAHYPLLQGLLLMPSCGDGGGHDLWVWDDLDGRDGNHKIEWDLRCRPGPHRIVPLVHILPSQLGTQAGHPAIVNPGCL